jgi:hypothetical protein
MKPFLSILAILTLTAVPLRAQTTPTPIPTPIPSPIPDPSTDPVAIQLTALRDAFAKKLADTGTVCPIAPPKLLLQNVNTWAHYDAEANTLTTPLWQQLTRQDQSAFYRLAGSNPTLEDAHREFEIGIHHWVFIHEMSHWAQACLHQDEDRMPYDYEYGANRIAIAFWRETDNKLLEHVVQHYEDVIKYQTSPVPLDQEVEEYFNNNFDKISPTPANAWFQSEMITELYEKRPKPTFKESLQLPLYPGP